MNGVPEYITETRGKSNPWIHRLQNNERPNGKMCELRWTASSKLPGLRKISKQGKNNTNQEESSDTRDYNQDRPTVRTNRKDIITMLEKVKNIYGFMVPTTSQQS